MTTSPAVNEFFERGTRKGKKPASTAIAVAAPTSAKSRRESADNSSSARARTAAPIDTVIHQ